MKNISTDLQAHLQEEVTTLAMCWRIRRRDGVVLGFTGHDRPLRWNGVTYRPTAAFEASAITGSNDLSVDTLDVSGILSSAAITEGDLMAGRYDHAQIGLFWLNWAAPDMGPLILRTGWIGEISLDSGRFTAEIRGLTQALQQDIGAVYSPECRADFGDLSCKVSPDRSRVTGTVTEVASGAVFTDGGRAESADVFRYGLLTWLTGANGGLSMEVRAFAAGQFTLFSAMPAPIAVGDLYTAHAGCDKRAETCRDRFGNIANFRGEPFVPGGDAVIDYPGLG